jgi:5-methylcytosine-specific restriction enzyme A
MSNRRSKPGACYTQLKRDESGRALCRWCEHPVPKGRRTFCSKNCAHEWNVRTDPGYARRCVYRRDRGVCSICGLDTGRIKRIADRLWAISCTTSWKFHFRPYPSAERRREQLEIMLTILGIWAGHSLSYGSKRLLRHLWEADHIVPVVEGGGECGLENLRTVCLRCHKSETKKLAARRALAKRKQQVLFGNTP